MTTEQQDNTSIAPVERRVRLKKDREWRDYPLGTKAYAFDGGYWIKVKNGWKWCSGSTFPTPGADAFGNCIELPIEV